MLRTESILFREAIVCMRTEIFGMWRAFYCCCCFTYHTRRVYLFATALNLGCVGHVELEVRNGAGA